MMQTRVFLLAVALCVIATAARAGTIAQWSAQPYENDIVANGSSATFLNFASKPTTYTAGNVISPAQGATYYPNNAGRTANFNGAFSVDPATRAAVFGPPNTNPDQIQSRAADGNTAFTAMYVFEDFLPGFTGALQTIESQRYRWASSSTGTSGTSRLLFQANDNSWYASDSQNLTTQFELQQITNVSAANWYPFTPHNAGVASVGVSTVTPSSFVNVKAVGIYFDLVGVDNLGTSIGYFQATADVIPEPATLSLVALCGLGLCLRRV